LEPEPEQRPHCDEHLSRQTARRRAARQTQTKSRSSASFGCPPVETAPLHVAHLDKARPVLVLTRELVRPHPRTVTVAPITTTIRGLSTEVPVDVQNGLTEASVVSCDNITTIPSDTLGVQIGVLLDPQERELSRALQAAFDRD
jgi:mRNA interferase MazF